MQAMPELKQRFARGEDLYRGVSDVGFRGIVVVGKQVSFKGSLMCS